MVHTNQGNGNDSQSRIFSSTGFDQWLEEAKIDLSAKELVIKRKIGGTTWSRLFAVLQRSERTEDLFDLVGKVKSVNYLPSWARNCWRPRCLLGENAYDSRTRVSGFARCTFNEHRGWNLGKARRSLTEERRGLAGAVF